MSQRVRARLQVVDPLSSDAILSSNDLSAIQGVSVDQDLLCGDCGALLLANFSVQEAKHYFIGELGRTLAECSSCFAKNLLSTQVRKRN